MINNHYWLQYLGFFIFLGLNISTFSQCPDPFFDLKSEYCQGEIIYPENVSAMVNYRWELCGDNIDNEINRINYGRLGSIFRASYSLEFIQTALEGYGFVIRNSGYGYRFTIDPPNNSITSPEEIISNSGFISLPRDLKLVELNNFWLGVVTNSGSKNPAIVKFDSLDNNIPEIIEMPLNANFFGTYGLDIIDMNGTLVALMGQKNTGNLKVTSFNNGYGNLPIESTYNIPNITSINGIDVVLECGIYHAFITSKNEGKVIRLSFINGFHNPPQVFEFASIANASKVLMAVENGFYYLFVQSDSGDLFRLKFGNSLSNLPTITLIPKSSGNISGIEMVQSKDNSILYGVDYSVSNNGLFGIEFSNDCTIQNHQSEKMNPTNLKIENPGLYNLRLTGTDENGFTKAIEKSFEVISSIAPNLTITSQNLCTATPILFDSLNSSNNISNFSWDFGDGSPLSTESSPEHIYGTPGNYPVSLSVTAPNGCSQLALDTISVYDAPQANFILPSSNICSNADLLFTNTTVIDTAAPVSYSWNFNNEADTSSFDAQYRFPSGGLKSIELTASLEGCPSVSTQSLDLLEGEMVEFSIDSVCLGLPNQFVDLTSRNGIVSGTWNLGDGNFSDQIEFTHFYSTPGTYNISLSIENDLGCVTEKKDTLLVHFLPEVNFQVPPLCRDTEFTPVNSTGVTNANVATWEWKDLSSNIILSTEKIPVLNFSDSEDKMIQLKAISNFGCADSLQELSVVRSAARLNIAFDKLCIDELSILEALIIPSEEDSSGIPEWRWLETNFTKSGSLVYHSFNVPGKDTITLGMNSFFFEESDTVACLSKTELPIEIFPKPNWDLDLAYACADTETYLIDRSNYFGDNNHAQWYVDINGNGYQGRFLNDSISFEFNESGGISRLDSYLLTNNNCEYSYTELVYIHPRPQAVMKADPIFATTAPLTVNFTDNSGGNLESKWNFGIDDLSTGNNKFESFTYNEMGSFLSQLTVTNPETGCFDIAFQPIYIGVEEVDLALDSIAFDAENLQVFVRNLTEQVPITEIDFYVSLESGVELKETVPLHLYSGGLGLAEQNIDLSFDIQNTSGLKYICIEAYPRFLPDSDNSNNKYCLPLLDKVIVNPPFPNPASDYFKINIIRSEPSTLELILFNSLGKPVQKIRSEYYSDSFQEFTFPLSDKSSGTYFLRVISSGQSTTFPVIIQN